MPISTAPLAFLTLWYWLKTTAPWARRLGPTATSPAMVTSTSRIWCCLLRTTAHHPGRPLWKPPRQLSRKLRRQRSVRETARCSIRPSASGRSRRLSERRGKDANDSRSELASQRLQPQPPSVIKGPPIPCGLYGSPGQVEMTALDLSKDPPTRYTAKVLETEKGDLDYRCACTLAQSVREVVEDMPDAGELA